MVQETYDAILNRFYGFDDGLIRSFRLMYSEDGTKHAEIIVACRDAESSTNENWVAVTVSIRDVSEAKFVEGSHTTLQVLSDGLHICQYDDLVGVEFGGAYETPRTMDELRKSEAFVVGKKVGFEIGPF